MKNISESFSVVTLEMVQKPELRDVPVAGDQGFTCCHWQVQRQTLKGQNNQLEGKRELQSGQSKEAKRESRRI